MSVDRTRILVAVDGSEHSFRAVQYAGDLLPSDRSRLSLFHVLDQIPDAFWDLESQPMFHADVVRTHAWESQQEEGIRAFMKRAQAHLVGRGFPEESVSIQIRKREKGVARDLLKESADGYQALILGRRGLSPLKDLILGSVAEKLAGGLSGIPVCVVGEGGNAGKVLIAMDGSPEAKKTVQFSTAAFSGRGLEVLLLHVMRAARTQVYAGTGTTGGREDLSVDEGDRAAFTRLEQKMSQLLAEQIGYMKEEWGAAAKVEASVIHDAESRVKTIVEIARAGGYGTILLGRRGLTRVQQFLMGSVSRKVLQATGDRACWIVC